MQEVDGARGRIETSLGLLDGSYSALDLVKGSPDQMIGNVERPFFDYLNVRHLYLAPDDAIRPAGMVERYRQMVGDMVVDYLRG